MEKKNLPHWIYEHPIASEITQSIWPITCFKLKRNIARLPFPGKMNKNEKLGLFDTLSKAICESKALSNPIAIHSENLTSIEKQKLYERFFIEEDLSDSKPGMGFIVDDNMRCLISLNTQDHLCISMIDTDSSWNNTWDQLNALDNSLNQALGFAYNTTFGFLTADPRYCGTGLSISSYLHLPAILQDENHSPHLEELHPHIEILGIDELEPNLGNIAIVQNRYSIGITEEQIFNATHTYSMQLLHEETRRRSSLDQDPSLKDKISRAFAILKHSYELTPKEGIEALSLIKLGHEMEWISNLSEQGLLSLFFELRRAQFRSSLQESEEKELPHARAEKVHETLKDASLNI